tara:strand:+ start:839 stop:1261 length:423 start_codon:yes stop_codon:yes gene_type:complete
MTFKKPKVGDEIVHKTFNGYLEESRNGVVYLVLSSQFIYVSKTNTKHFCLFKENWKYFKPEKEEKPLNTNKPQQVKRKRIVFPNETRIQATRKQPKSEKNIARLKLYRRTKLGSILERNPEVTLTDIKYDIKCGYAEIVQ